MYILLDACQHPGILRIIYFGSLLIDIVFTLVPIGLIVMMMIDFSKAVISGDEKAAKNTKIVVKRIVYAMIVFCVPWIVEAFMSLLDSVGFSVDYQECITNARSGDFDYYDKLLKEENKLEKEHHETNMKRSEGITANGNMSVVADNLLNTIKGELGRRNDDLKYSSNYGGSKGLPWCAYFVHWALDNTNVTTDKDLWDYIVAGDTIGHCGGSCAGDLIPIFDSHSNLQFYKSSYYGGSGYTPKKGDLIFFWWKDNNPDGAYWDGSVSGVIHASHIGFVTSVSGNTIYTIEGNTKVGMVAERERVLNSSEVMGFGSWY